MESVSLETFHLIPTIRNGQNEPRRSVPMSRLSNSWTMMKASARVLRKDPELIRRCCDLALEWLTAYGKAFIDEVRPEAIYT